MTITKCKYCNKEIEYGRSLKYWIDWSALSIEMAIRCKIGGHHEPYEKEDEFDKLYERLK